MIFTTAHEGQFSGVPKLLLTFFDLFWNVRGTVHGRRRDNISPFSCFTIGRCKIFPVCVSALVNLYMI